MIKDSKFGFLKDKIFWLTAWFVFLASFLIFFVLSGGYFKGVSASKDTVAIVGNEKITQTALNEQIYGIDFQGSVDNPAKVDNSVRKQLIDRLVNWKIAELEAKKLGITVTDLEVGQEIDNRLKDQYLQYTEEQKALARKSMKSTLLENKVKDQVTGWREGKVVVIRFDRNYENGADLKSAATQQNIQEEKKYAKSLADEISNDISSGKLTFEEAMVKAGSDSKVGKPAWGEGSKSYTFSFAFNKEDSKNKGIFRSSKNLWTEIFNAKKDQVTKPFIFTLSGESTKDHEAAYALVMVTNSSNSSAASYTDWLKNKKTEYNVRVF
ncbi:MAG: SurA N-terminal domain-containing protein [Patescibacteria group bacterium]|nr:SurA N-terminal domain-containing protein [Patescibacteria group bacterium]